jgi:hypothetical protein
MSRYLYNTSGSGKTRLLLEGLWRNWGFYITASSDSDNIGSSDLQEILQDMRERRRLIRLDENNLSEALNTNRDVAIRRFHLLFYVRVLTFRIFLECAAAMPGGISDIHKGKWLLLQLAPWTLVQGDIFIGEIRILGGTSDEFLIEHIQNELQSIEHFIGSRRLFCVLDEAQITTDQFFEYFSSNNETITPQSILPQIIGAWLSRVSGLIVSGTRVSNQQPPGSLVAKDSDTELSFVTDIGAFDNPEKQRRYLEQYFPPDFLDSEEGNSVVARIGCCLHGRYILYQLSIE